MRKILFFILAALLISMTATSASAYGHHAGCNYHGNGVYGGSWNAYPAQYQYSGYSSYSQYSRSSVSPIYTTYGYGYSGRSNRGGWGLGGYYR